MKNTYLLLLIISCFLSCKRKSDSPVNPTTGDVLVKSIYVDETVDYNSTYSLYEYDSRGLLTDLYYSNVILSNNPDSNSIHIKYEYNGNKIVKAKLVSNTWDLFLFYEENNNYPAGSEMRFNYNSLGKIQSINFYDKNGLFYLSDSILYDGFGRLNQIIRNTSPLKGYTLYTYNPEGNLSSICFNNADSLVFENYQPTIVNPSASIDYLLNYAFLELLYAKYPLDVNDLHRSNYLPYSLSHNMWSDYGSYYAPYRHNLYWALVREWYYQYPKKIQDQDTYYHFEYIAKPK